MALSPGPWPAAVEAAPDAPVLVLRALGLGDGLTAVPALRGLRRALPGRSLVLACAHPVARLLHAHGLVDRVLPTRELGEAPPGHYLGRHLAVDLHGRGPQSHRLLQAGRPLALLGFGCPEAGVDGPAWRADEHEVDRWCRLVASIGGRSGRDDLRLPAPPPDRADGAVLVHPGAAAGSRRWPLTRWAAVAGELARGGHPVAVTGSAAEIGPAAELVARAGAPVLNLAGRLDLDALAALVARARLLLCGDTGVAHLATAFGTPSVLLFGPTPPGRWGPAIDPERHAVLWSGRARVGDPHAAEPDPALLRITPAEVLAAAGQLLAAPTAPTVRDPARLAAPA